MSVTHTHTRACACVLSFIGVDVTLHPSYYRCQYWQHQGPFLYPLQTLQASYVGSTAEDWEEPEEPEDRDSRECYTVTGTLRKDRPDVFDDQDILPQPSKAKVNHVSSIPKLVCQCCSQTSLIRQRPFDRNMLN